MLPLARDSRDLSVEWWSGLGSQAHETRYFLIALEPREFAPEESACVAAPRVPRAFQFYRVQKSQRQQRRIWQLGEKRYSHEHHVRVQAGVVAAQVGIGDVMIFVAEVDAVVPGSEHLHARPKLGGEVELSGAEHPSIEIEEAPTACEKWLDPATVKKVDLGAQWTPAGTVGIYALAARLGIAHDRQGDDFCKIA
jgi:hypothetical protein